MTSARIHVIRLGMRACAAHWELPAPDTRRLLLLKHVTLMLVPYSLYSIPPQFTPPLSPSTPIHNDQSLHSSQLLNCDPSIVQWLDLVNARGESASSRVYTDMMEAAAIACVQVRGLWEGEEQGVGEYTDMIKAAAIACMLVCVVGG